MLLVMFKPAGACRWCSITEADLVMDAWRDLLMWLRGADPSRLVHRELVGQVARAAALRRMTLPEYDVEVWVSQVAGLDDLPARVEEEVSLPALCRIILRQLHLDQEQLFTGCLNRVTIELIYSRSPRYLANREIIVPRLLDGPVVVEVWRGRRVHLAHAVKLLVRVALSTEELTNLLHIGRATSEEIQLITRSLCGREADVSAGEPPVDSLRPRFRKRRRRSTPRPRRPRSGP